ncbi:MAG: SH3 domain-containing protein [Pseudobutyrivibrio sp.]|nr:SH3 domain-containing protein [Pseudobutyrivibrio sp.]
MRTFRARINKAVDLAIKNKRYFWALVVLICIVLLLVFATDKPIENTDPMAGATDKYSAEISPELDALIRNYYQAYQNGDVEAVRAIANPLSDEEASYIQFYSQYLESFNDIKIFTKRGLDTSSMLVSVELNLKLKDIDTPAPGFDFFYVETAEDGSLYINNLYGSFNQLNGIFDCDAKVTTLIATFIQQDDVLEKQALVSQKYQEALANDVGLNNFVSKTLPEGTVNWNTEYKAAVAQAEAVAAQEEADRLAQEEAERQAAIEAEEEANAYYGKTNDEVKVRTEASSDSTSVGTLSKGTKIKIYALEGDFYKFDFSGSRKYVSKDYVDVQEKQSETDQDNNSDNNDGDDNANDNSSLPEKGEEITLSATCNIREKMDTDSSKVAVAYAGEKVKVVMNYAEGWTKVKYGNKEGYIKTELLTE